MKPACISRYIHCSRWQFLRQQDINHSWNLNCSCPPSKFSVKYAGFMPAVLDNAARRRTVKPTKAKALTAGQRWQDEPLSDDGVLVILKTVTRKMAMSMAAATGSSQHQLWHHAEHAHIHQGLSTSCTEYNLPFDECFNAADSMTGKAFCLLKTVPLIPKCHSVRPSLT